MPDGHTAVDLVVIGGGALGLATAFEARRGMPNWSILVVDRDLPTGGATRRSATVVVSYGVSDAHRELARSSVSCLRDGPLAAFADQVPAYVVVPRGNVAELQARFTSGPVRHASRDARASLIQAVPGLQLRKSDAVLDATGGVFTFDVRAFASAVLEDGQDIACWPKAEVVTIQRSQGGYRLETTAGSTITAPRVLIATGPWTPPPVEGESCRDRIPVKRVAALHLARPKSEMPMVFWPNADCFLLPEAHNLLFSFSRNSWLNDGDKPSGGFGTEDLEDGLARLEKLSGPLVDTVIGGRAHFDAYAEERLPRVRSDPGAPGVVWLRGGSGSGVGLAPALAEKAFQQLVGSTA